MSAKPSTSRSPASTNGSPASTNGAAPENPERYDPRGQAGKLIDSEHRGRYWWASQAVVGKDVLDAGCGVGYGLEILSAAGAESVTGVDIDEEAVKQAEHRFGEKAKEILCADLRELHLPDESFDVVVCFEAIEHIEDGERALGELHRVLRPDGLLLISSPNPDVYPSGNEHHVHEYRPAELAAILSERFATVTSYRQHPWLASVIEAASAGGSAPRRRETRTTKKLEPGGETYSIHAATDADPAKFEGLMVLGADFEVRWWSDHLKAAEHSARDGVESVEKEARGHIEAAQQEARKQIEGVQREARESIEAAKGLEENAREQIEVAKADAREQIEIAKSDARERIDVAEADAREQIVAAEARAQGQAEAVERHAREQREEAEQLLAAKEQEFRRALEQSLERESAAKIQLQETASALLEANQSLAQLPVLSHRFEELTAHCGGLQAHIGVLEGSRSWRMAAPLRRFRRLFSRRK